MFVCWFCFVLLCLFGFFFSSNTWAKFLLVAINPAPQSARLNSPVAASEFDFDFLTRKQKIYDLERNGKKDKAVLLLNCRSMG